MARPIRTVPAILTDNATALEKLVRQTESFTDYAQFDLMDGKFVPSHSYSVDDLVDLKTNIKWEAHLMMLQPEEYLEKLKNAGAQKIVFHYEAVASCWNLILLIRQLGMKIGMAINPETPIAVLKEWVPEINSVLFMAVHPGYYGAKFIPEVLDKIREFRRNYALIEIGIDGGIKENNITEIAGTGVDVIYIGSAIFLQPDPAAAYRRLTELAQSGAA